MKRMVLLASFLGGIIILVAYLRCITRQDTGVSFQPGQSWHPAFDDDSDFVKLGPPKPGDWLDRFREPGQTFEQYVKSKPLQPDKKRNKIVLQPIGPFNDQEKELLGKLKEYTAIFFQMPVEMLEGLSLPETRRYKRERQWSWSNKTWLQYHTGFLMEQVLEPRLSPDAFCYLGITMVDLYPDDSWNYVFGQARPVDRVGIYSLVRYFPDFWNEPDTKENQLRALRRSCSTLAHEICHIFGMAHCIFYKCLICGSNSLEESDRRPLQLCPVCLKKLHWNIKFDIIKRYEELEKFYRHNELISEADWTKNRLAKIKKAR